MFPFLCKATPSTSQPRAAGPSTTPTSRHARAAAAAPTPPSSRRRGAGRGRVGTGGGRGVTGRGAPRPFSAPGQYAASTYADIPTDGTHTGWMSYFNASRGRGAM